MTGTGAKKLSQISWSTSSTGYPRIDTRIDMKTTQGKPSLFSSIELRNVTMKNISGTEMSVNNTCVFGCNPTQGRSCAG